MPNLAKAFNNAIFCCRAAIMVLAFQKRITMPRILARFAACINGGE